MKNIYLVTLLILGFLLGTFDTYSQLSTAMDGKIDISPINGSMDYTYPISNTTIDGFNMKVDLKYISNLQYTAFAQHYYEASDTSANFRKDGFGTFSRVHPTWLLSFNGFAVQVLYGANSFLSGDDDDGVLPQMPFNYEIGFLYGSYHNHSYLINGYDYSNNLDTPTDNQYQDVIQILRGDGSILELRNSRNTSHPTPFVHNDDYFTGIYYENALNANSFGIVEIDTEHNWPEYIRAKYYKVAPGDTVNIRPRVLKYYPGDGLEYVFREYVAPFGMRIDELRNKTKVYQNPQDPEDTFTIVASYMPLPTVFYLEEVNSEMRNITTFKRKFHEHEDDEIHLRRGRSPITEFANHLISYNVDNIKIEIFDKIYTLNFGLKIGNHSYFEYENSNYADFLFMEWLFGHGHSFFDLFVYSNIKDEKDAKYNLFQEPFIGWAMINEIIDPENRSIKFGYQTQNVNYKKFKQGVGELNINTVRIDSIVTPSEQFLFEYHTDDNEVMNDFYENDNFDYDFYNTIKTVKVYDKIPSLHNDTSLYEYKFDLFTQHTPNTICEENDWRVTRVVKKNNSLSSMIKADTTYSHFEKRNVFPLKVNNYETYKTPKLVFTPLVKSIKKYSNETITTLYNYVRGNEIDVSRMYFFLTSEESYYDDTQKNIQMSKITYEYEFEVMDNYEYYQGSMDVKNYYGLVIKEKTTNVFEPNCEPDENNDCLLYKTVDKFLNLPFVYNKYIGPYSQEAKNWDKKASTLSQKQLEHGTGTYTNVNVFSTTDRPNYINLPYLFGLKTESIILDPDDNILGGRKYVYEEDFPATANPTHRRGALLEDYIIGMGGVTKLNRTYKYSGGNYRNFLESTKNISGTETKNYYLYEDVPGYSTSVYPKGKILKNNEYTSDYQLKYKHHQFEAPLVTENSVRKYKFNQQQQLVIDTTYFREFYEKTDFGLISGKIDANGWFYKSKYDNIGRKLFDWHPFDFPTDYSIDFRDETTEECVSITESYIHTTEDTYVVTHLGQGQSSHSHISNTYDVNGTIGDLRIGQTSTYGLDRLADDLPEEYEYKETNSFVTLMYQASPLDQFHNGANITDAKLQLFLREYPYTCQTLLVEIPEFNFSERILLGCPPVNTIEPGCGNETGDNYTYISLSNVIHLFQQVPLGIKIPIQIKVIHIAENLPKIYSPIAISPISDFNGPCIKVTTNKYENYTLDYTFRYIHDDENRVTQSFSKIDDNVVNTYQINPTRFKHNHQSQWQATQNGKDGRYTASFTGYGAFNSPLKVLLPIGNPYNPIHTDSIVTYFSGHWRKDQLGFVTAEHIDPWGRLGVAHNEDSTFKYIQYFYDLQENLDDDPEIDYHGFCFLIYFTDEINGFKYSYYDFFGNLRKTIVPLDQSTYIVSKYFYDLRGNFIRVETDDIVTNEYVYDDFGRLIEKFQQDVGTSTYSYDDMGNLRFSQNELQADENKLSFTQYDDLGRKTIAGEAKLSNSLPSGDRFTDYLNPNYLKIPSGTSHLLTANRTLWLEDNPVHYMPTVADGNSQSDYFNYAKTITQSIDFEFDSEYFDEFNNLAPPYILHQAKYYEGNIPSADSAYFEDISKYPEFVTLAVHYDDFPERKGNIWKNIPQKEIWQKIAPRADLQNLKGRQAAIAYRDIHNEAFHYVVFTYDARGRIDAILRFTENIGFDAVYYNYNSQNSVISIAVMDMNKQFRIWYEYDNNGRVEKVYSYIGGTGTGFLANVAQPMSINNIRFPNPLGRPVNPDISYEYNKRGGIENINYEKFDVVKNLIYDPRGWVNQLVIEHDETPLFTQILGRDDIGNVLTQNSQHVGFSMVQESYQYNDNNSLTHWTNTTRSLSETYNYDVFGNRNGFSNEVEAHIYTLTLEMH